MKIDCSVVRLGDVGSVRDVRGSKNRLPEWDRHHRRTPKNNSDNLDMGERQRDVGKLVKKMKLLIHIRRHLHQAWPCKHPNRFCFFLL